MSTLRDSLAAMREAFIDEARMLGFRLDSDCAALVGDIDIGDQQIEHQIKLDDDFPITMPRVSTTSGEGGLSWHRESDGSLCLWPSDEASDLPWQSARKLIERVAEWHKQDVAGWPDDDPDLDLERYWQPALLSELVLYPDLDGLVGRDCLARKKHEGRVLQVERGKAPKSQQRQRSWGVAVVDVGELAQPVRDFDELEQLLPAPCAGEARKGIEQGRIRILIVRYQRQGHDAALALYAMSRDTRELGAVESAHTGEQTHYVRAGLDAETLLHKKVAIIGLGAVGSSTAELLARSGVGGFTFVEHDQLRPGNCIRHIADHNYLGWNKAEAVRKLLHNAHVIDESCIHVIEDKLTSVDDVGQLFSTHDLVVDATGDNAATALVWMASEALNRPAVSVCLQRGGSVARVDRTLLRDGESHAPPVPPGGPHLDLREGGCGDPISPAPPWACLAAASRAVGMATDLLTDRNQYPPTHIDSLIGDPNATEWE